jgi:GrpB-like predicted nucleotidyltransferase (UPF0157 family)/uncharacterized protein YhfF
MTDEQVTEFWEAFVASAGIDGPHTAWGFGSDPRMADDLGLLVRDGPKRATTSLRSWYVDDDEPMPAVGNLGVVLNGSGDPLCVVRTTSVEIRRFGDVDASFAWTEGEGDRSLEYWRDAHIRFFESEGRPVDEDTEVVLEIFELLWAGPDTGRDPAPRPDEIGRATREEQLLAAMVGDARPSTGPVRLAEYDEEWPGAFEREAARIRRALGESALQVEHVGSTSVPSLAAKPIVDILLVVADSSDEPAYVPAMEREGYVLRISEPDWQEHRLFKGTDTDINLHVFSAGSPEIERMLLFRDWIRESEPDRKLYERAKQDLARKDWDYIQDYADAKTQVVEEILARAVDARGRMRDGGPGG